MSRYPFTRTDYVQSMWRKGYDAESIAYHMNLSLAVVLEDLKELMVEA